MEYRLGNIDAKLDTLLESRKEERATMKSHDRRITSLEKWRWMIGGGVFAIGAIAGFILRFV